MNADLMSVVYEKILIQFMFNKESIRDKVVPFLDSKVFFNHNHSQIIENILRFMNTHGRFPRVNELKLFIKESEVYETLTDIMNYDTSEYDEKFILTSIEEYYRSRLLLNVFMDSSEKISKGSGEVSDSPQEILNALSFTFESNIGTSLLDDSEKVFKELHNVDSVIPTMIKSLDKYIDGGVHEKTLNGILAGTGVGKSLVLCALSVNMLLQNKKVLYISLEMSEARIIERLLANLFDIDIGLLKNLSKAQFDKCYDMVKRRLKTNFHVVQYGEKSLSSNKITAILKEFKVKKSIEFDCIVLDYMALMTTNNKIRDLNSYSELKLISQELRAVAQNHSIPIWTAYQVNRTGLNKIDADIQDISESAGILHTLDLLVAVGSSDELRAAGKYKLSILKNRYGVPNLTMYVGVSYNRMRIFDLEEELKDQDIAKPKNMVDEASVQVLSTMKSNVQNKRDKFMGIE
jgi:replicative DNA helicase